MSQQAQNPPETVRPGPPRSNSSQPVATSPAAASVPPVTLLPRRPLEAEHKDGFREIAETIVFVVVLVLLLKTFLAEAFVIPTGSMATTLLGYHKDMVCEKCGYRFKVNASDETEKRPQENSTDIVIEGICPNCRYRNSLPGHFRRGGDQ